MTRSVRPGASCALAALLVLSACGGGTDSGAPPTPPPPTYSIGGRVFSSGATWTAQPSVPFGIFWGVDFFGPTIYVAGAGGVIARHD